MNNYHIVALVDPPQPISLSVLPFIAETEDEKYKIIGFNDERYIYRNQLEELIYEGHVLECDIEIKNSSNIKNPVILWLGEKFRSYLESYSEIPKFREFNHDFQDVTKVEKENLILGHVWVESKDVALREIKGFYENLVSKFFSLTLKNIELKKIISKLLIGIFPDRDETKATILILSEAKENILEWFVRLEKVDKPDITKSEIESRINASVQTYNTKISGDKKYLNGHSLNGVRPNSLPREGMMATLRNRRALVSRVKPFDSQEGRLHLVEVEYTDSEGRSRDSIVWEREVGNSLLEPSALPNVSDDAPMNPEDFDALLRATRWSAITPFLSPDGSNQPSVLPIASPFHGAVQVEDFQLEPLLRALQMPRISLLLADDVGLGKTIEAGLILTELLLRRRIRRVLILSPAALRDQWQQEMHDKFSLSFDVVDRQETYKLRKRLGLDANPWRTFSRVVTSYHYLRQDDVLEQFLSTCRNQENNAQLPWDLLIVDEAHNLMPAPFGEDSDLVKMLRAITPYFEHKLFLSATPHNGHTRSFSGLLQLLDPVRFVQTPELKEAEHKRIRDVVIRRLKREINEDDEKSNKPKRFATRYLRPVHLHFGKKEKSLAKAFSEFRVEVKSVVAKAKKSEQLAGSFAVEVLNKRLLSCHYTFADSWYRFLEGMDNDDEATQSEVLAARKASEEDIDDDLEREGRAKHASRTAGAWLKPIAEQLKGHIERVTNALRACELELRNEALTLPKEDARFDDLVNLIKDKLFSEQQTWGDNERLIVFTEYKTTLDYLEKRLRKTFKDDSGERIRVLFGGLDPKARKEIRLAFNDPRNPVRVLLATDAASEGLNLQETARYLLHYEIPWNPSRLEQRNGRIDRHGQARDVMIFHFTSEDDADLKFLGRVVGKVENVREDLGAVGEVFDAAFQRRFTDDGDPEKVFEQLSLNVDRERQEASIPTLDRYQRRSQDEASIKQLCQDLDLSATTLKNTLDVALGIDAERPRLEGPDAKGRFRLKTPIPPRWVSLVDDSLRIPTGPLANSLPNLVFEAAGLITQINNRPVFRQSPDTVLLHLGHPIFRQSLARFARLRFPGSSEVSATRWIARRGTVPKGADALLLLTVEELAVNSLREPFHHWVRTLRIPIKNGELLAPLPYSAPAEDKPGKILTKTDLATARNIWDEISPDVKTQIQARSKELRTSLEAALKVGVGKALQESREALTNQIKEVKEMMSKQSIREIEKEKKKITDKLNQRQMMLPLERDQLEDKLGRLEDELKRRQDYAQAHLELLEREKKRVLEFLIPQRFSLGAGGVQLFPLAVELRLPEVMQ